MKIINPKFDYCMKELFQNEVVRKYFLSDILGISVQEIKSAKLMNTFLWKRRREQKQGILDVLMEMNDNAKINIEIQLKALKSWDKRQLFYLAKLFVDDLKIGEDYPKLKKCIGISILDFKLTDREEYHNIYRLMDERGNLFSDSLEIHTLELCKKLSGTAPIDDWIRLFNAESEEELDMIQTKNAGVLEAIREVKLMSLNGKLRARHEARLKAERDQRAREAYVRDEGIGLGIKGLVGTCQELGVSREETYNKVKESFSLSERDTEEQMKRYWRENDK